jgi:hypothetical protein
LEVQYNRAKDTKSNRTIMKKINHNSKVKIKSGDMAGSDGFVNLIASINGVKRYYVTRSDNSVKWYTYFQLRLI